jgi:hypothetical protein
MPAERDSPLQGRLGVMPKAAAWASRALWAQAARSLVITRSAMPSATKAAGLGDHDGTSRLFL